MELQGQRSLERKPTNLGRNPPQVQREAANQPEPHLIVAGRGIRLSGVSGHPSDGDDDIQGKKHHLSFSMPRMRPSPSTSPTSTQPERGVKRLRPIHAGRFKLLRLYCQLRGGDSAVVSVHFMEQADFCRSLVPRSHALLPANVKRTKPGVLD